MARWLPYFLATHRKKGLILNNIMLGFKAVFIIIFAVSIVRYLGSRVGFRWITTVNVTFSLYSLGLITYFITTAISGNIALSLGMVGALSIVRFRNPVKTPMELVVYFYAISLGITASVGTLYVLSLAGTVSTLFLFFYLAKRWLPSKVFTSGPEIDGITSLCILKASNSITFPEWITVQAINFAEGVYEYNLLCTSRVELENLMEIYVGQGSVTSYRIMS
jgi:hypothetical protein